MGPKKAISFEASGPKLEKNCHTGTFTPYIAVGYDWYMIANAVNGPMKKSRSSKCFMSNMGASGYRLGKNSIVLQIVAETNFANPVTMGKSVDGSQKRKLKDSLNC